MIRLVSSNDGLVRSYANFSTVFCGQPVGDVPKVLNSSVFVLDAQSEPLQIQARTEAFPAPRHTRRQHLMRRCRA